MILLQNNFYNCKNTDFTLVSAKCLINTKLEKWGLLINFSNSVNLISYRSNSKQVREKTKTAWTQTCLQIKIT